MRDNSFGSSNILDNSIAVGAPIKVIGNVIVKDDGRIEFRCFQDEYVKNFL